MLDPDQNPKQVIPNTRSASDAQGESLGSGRFRAWALVGCLLLAAAVGFVIGSTRSDVMHLKGIAHVGERLASIEADGWSYGISESVAWIDASGTQHEDGWPDCLGSAGNTAPVRFGAVDVTSLGIRAVVYVDCRSE